MAFNDVIFDSINAQLQIVRASSMSEGEKNDRIIHLLVRMIDRLDDIENAERNKIANSEHQLKYDKDYVERYVERYCLEDFENDDIKTYWHERRKYFHECIQKEKNKIAACEFRIKMIAEIKPRYEQALADALDNKDKRKLVVKRLINEFDKSHKPKSNASEYYYRRYKNKKSKLLEKIRSSSITEIDKFYHERKTKNDKREKVFQILKIEEIKHFERDNRENKSEKQPLRLEKLKNEKLEESFFKNYSLESLKSWYRYYRRSNDKYDRYANEGKIIHFFHQIFVAIFNTFVGSAFDSASMNMHDRIYHYEDLWDKKRYDEDIEKCYEAICLDKRDSSFDQPVLNKDKSAADFSNTTVLPLEQNLTSQKQKALSF